MRFIQKPRLARLRATLIEDHDHTNPIEAPSDGRADQNQEDESRMIGADCFRGTEAEYLVNRSS